MGIRDLAQGLKGLADSPGSAAYFRRLKLGWEVMRVRNSLLVACATVSLAGCATQVIGAITLSNISSVAGIASTLATGQDLGEHALSLIMDKDCRFSEALLTDERDVCEEYGSPRTKNDFQGVLVAGTDADGKVVRAAPMLLSASEGSVEDGNTDAVFEKIHAAQTTQYAEAEQRVAARTQKANDALLAFATTAPTPGESAPMVVAQADILFTGLDGTSNTMVATADVAAESSPSVVVSLNIPQPKQKPAEPTLIAQAPVLISQAEAPAAVVEAAPAVETAPVQLASVMTPIRKPAQLEEATVQTASLDVEEIAPAATQTIDVAMIMPKRKPVELEVAAVEAPVEAAQVLAAAEEPAPAPKPIQVADYTSYSGSRLIVPLRKPVTLISATATAASASLIQPAVATLTSATPYVTQGE